MTRVAVEEVRKVHPGGVVALDGLSFEIDSGELLALLGPSGSGKTTLLHLIAGLTRATSGKIRLDGESVDDWPPSRRDVALVMQEGSLLPHLTVRANLGFGMVLRRRPRDEVQRRVEQVAAELGITALLDRRPDTLSAGQRQRVAVGRALVRQPRILLLDEPFAGLDREWRTELRDRLVDLHRQRPVTTLFVTHDQEEALVLGRRVAVIGQGRLLQVGTPLELYARPASRTVARLVGPRPMNLVEGSLRASGKNWRFESQGLSLDLSAVETGSMVAGPAVLGVRPEELRWEEGCEDARGGRLTSRVVRIDWLGPDCDVHIELEGGQRLVVRVEAAQAPRPGELRHLRMPDQLHLFEATETGQRITVRPLPAVLR